MTTPPSPKSVGKVVAPPAATQGFDDWLERLRRSARPLTLLESAETRISAWLGVDSWRLYGIDNRQRRLTCLAPAARKAGPLPLSAATTANAHPPGRKATGPQRQVLTCSDVLVGLLELVPSPTAGDPQPDRRRRIQRLSQVLGELMARPDDAHRPQRLPSEAQPFAPLVSKGLLTAPDLLSAAARARKQNRSLAHILVTHNQIPQKVVGQCLAVHFRVPFVSCDASLPVPGPLLKGLKPAFLRLHRWVPVKQQAGTVQVAMADPDDLDARQQARALLKTERIEFCAAIAEEVEAFIDRFARSDQSSDLNLDMDLDLDDLLELLEQEDDDDQHDHGQTPAASGPDSSAVQLAERIITDAYAKNAAFVHIEPEPDGSRARVRLRMDGRCRPHLQLPRGHLTPLCTRFKVLAGLDIAERRLPQAGHFRFKSRKVPLLDLALTTLPTWGGAEALSLQLRRPVPPIRLERSDLSAVNRRRLLAVLRRARGMVLVTGLPPTDAAPWLLAMALAIQHPEIRICRLAPGGTDPVAGVSDITLKPHIGLDACRALRTALASDVDAVMIDQLRDSETVSMALDAAAGGRLVLAGLTSAGAAQAIVRLQDMGLPLSLLISSLAAVLACHNVRRLCAHCAGQAALTADDAALFQAGTGTAPALAAGTAIRRASGCPRCHGTGYSGRLTLHTLLAVTPGIRKLLRRGSDTATLTGQALADGMLPLETDAAEKVSRGLTDPNEIRRLQARLQPLG